MIVKLWHLLMILTAVTAIGCQGEEDASVKGLPALKASPEDKNVKSKSAGMSMPGDQLMMMRLDKNKDKKISPDEFPDGGLDGYDLDGDGTVTLDEMKKRTQEISNKGLSVFDEDEDEEKSKTPPKQEN